MKHLEFKCPRCNCEKLDEVETGFARYTAIEAIHPEGRLHYGETDTDEDASLVPEVRFQCLRCEHILLNPDRQKISTAAQLVEWINLHYTFSVENIREKLGVSEQQARNIRSIIFDLEPLRHEGNHISTAHRYLADAGLTHAPASDPYAAIRAISIEVDAPCYARWLWYVAALNPKETLAYHRREEYYFWTTEEELTQLEEQWKKKNNS